MPSIVSRLTRNALAVDSGVMVMSTILNGGLGLIFWITVARILPAADAGRASTLIVSATSLSSVALLSTGVFAERFLPTMSRPQQRRFLVAVMVASSLLAVALGISYDTWWAPAELLVRPWHRTIFPLAVTILTLFSLSDSLLLGLQRARWAAAKNLTHALAKLLAIPLFVLAGWHSFGVELVIAWTLPAALLLVVLSGTLSRRQVQERVFAAAHAPSALPPRRELLEYYAISVGWLLSQIVPSILIPLLVPRFAGLENAAYFNIAWIIVSLSGLAMYSLSGPFVAKAAQADTDLRAASITMIKMISLVSVGRFLLLAVGGPIALLIYGRDYFEHAWPILVIMGFSHFISGVAFLFGSLCRIYRRILYPMTVQALATVLVLTLTWFLLPRWSIVGIAWAYLIQDIVVLAAAVFPLKALLAQALANHRPAAPAGA